MQRRLTLLLLTLITPLFSSPHPDIPPSIEIKNGDLIFRQGLAFVSHLVMISDPKSDYSHVGMLFYEEGEWRVVHATPSEREENPDGVVIDTLDFFLHPDRSNEFAIYRIAASSDEQMSAVHHAKAQVGTPFHYQKERGTYCTLLLTEAWESAKNMELNLSQTHLNLPLLKGDYLFPSDLLSNPQLEEIYRSPPKIVIEE